MKDQQNEAIFQFWKHIWLLWKIYSVSLELNQINPEREMNWFRLHILETLPQHQLPISTSHFILIH